MMAAAAALPAGSGLTSAVCSALSLSRASVLRHRKALTAPPTGRKSRSPSSRALPDCERDQVLQYLREPRFADQTPTEVFATLLDEGTYLCSIRTMYRILAAQGEVGERRRQRTHPVYAKPELLATAPNEVWSWDITKLMGPVKWSYFYLYVILDIFSRRVVGWRVEHAESAAQFKELFIDAMEKHAVPRDQLTLHADRGGPMKAKTTALMLVDLGVLKSHSRPHTSNDNPFSEAHFKTLKYQPEFPKNFATIEQARVFCRRFFAWYNQDHHHAGIGLMTPDQIHFGQAKTVYAARQATLDAAFLNTPERFVQKPPKPPKIPTAVWINPPKQTEETQV
jgi:putative transposase